MQRVTRSTAVEVLAPRPETEGEPGYFSAGDKALGVPATVPGYEWFNMVQEELANIVTMLGSGVLSSAEYDQAAKAIQAFVESKAGVSWGNIADKPENYPASQHEHQIGDVAGLAEALDGMFNGEVSLVGTRGVDGTWVIPGLIIGKPLFIGADVTDAVSQSAVSIGVTAGAAIGKTNSSVGWVIDPNNSPPGFVTIPNATSISLDVSGIYTGFTLHAYQ